MVWHCQCVKPDESRVPLQDQQASLLDLDAGAGDQVLHDALLDERAAERDP
jgi:hypothetical protein